MKTMTIQFLPLFLLLVSITGSFPTVHGWSSSSTQPSSPSLELPRRAFLQKAALAVVTTTSVVAFPLRGVEAADDDDDKSQKAAAEKRQADKKAEEEARARKKLAEDTKKRLAVGRIGTI
jgi:hypothetical protein